MAGRYVLSATTVDVGNGDALQFEPCFNIGPSQEVPVIFCITEQSDVKIMKWGFHMKFSGTKIRLINAHWETLQDKKIFRPLLNNQRCLLPCSGFYEWKTDSEGAKKPYFIKSVEREMFCFAGLYRRCMIEDQESLECIIITHTFHKSGLIYERLPLIVPLSYQKEWLKNNTFEDIRDTVVDLEFEKLTEYSVSHIVNKPINDSPVNIQPEKSTFIF
jgi:putative SOS response-associated peptidase YedK